MQVCFRIAAACSGEMLRQNILPLHGVETHPVMHLFLRNCSGWDITSDSIRVWYLSYIL
jgi:hypothetical protein